MKKQKIKMIQSTEITDIDVQYFKNKLNKSSGVSMDVFEHNDSVQNSRVLINIQPRRTGYLYSQLQDIIKLVLIEDKEVLHYGELYKVEIVLKHLGVLNQILIEKIEGVLKYYYIIKKKPI